MGTSGWNYADWRGRLYPHGLPPRRWLEHYALSFETVEVNATFYRLASRDAVAGWARQTPPDFVFSVKASRYLTHMKRLTDTERGVARFSERIEPLIAAGKLGPVLWQLPESFHRDDERLAAALADLPAGRHCFEFRHPSWFADEVFALLREHGVALVLAHHPARQFAVEELTAPWTFVRFHHGTRGRRGNYSRAELDEWAKVVTRLRRTVEVYAYFNNDWEGFAVDNALYLKRRLAALEAERDAATRGEPPAS